MDCTQANQQHSAALYGELSEQESTAYANHLRDCDSCRSEHEALRRTIVQLDDWKDIDAPCNAQQFIERMESMDAPVSKFRSMPRMLIIGSLSGLAAAIALFFTLTALNARMTYQTGAVMVHWGSSHPDSAGFNKPPDPQRLEQNILQAVNRAVNQRSVDLLAAVDTYLSNQSRQDQQRNLMLLEHLESLRQQDRLEIENHLQFVAAGAAQESRITRAALTNLIDHIQGQPPRLARQNQ